MFPMFFSSRYKILIVKTRQEADSLPDGFLFCVRKNQSTLVPSPYTSQNRAEKEGSSPAPSRWLRSPKRDIRHTAVVGRRSSVVSRVTLVVSATVWCQRITGEQSSSRDSRTHSKP